MGIPTTTAAAIRAALIPLIEAIAPTYSDLSDQAWHYVDDEDPSGPAIRSFAILNSPSEETDGGIHGGGGIGYNYEMTIRAAYGGIPRTMAEDMIDEDARDLWLLLHPLPDAGGIDGLLPFSESYRIDFFDDEPGALVVDFTFNTHYKGRDS